MNFKRFLYEKSYIFGLLILIVIGIFTYIEHRKISENIKRSIAVDLEMRDLSGSNRDYNRFLMTNVFGIMANDLALRDSSMKLYGLIKKNIESSNAEISGELFWKMKEVEKRLSEFDSSGKPEELIQILKQGENVTIAITEAEEKKFNELLRDREFLLDEEDKVHDNYQFLHTLLLISLLFLMFVIRRERKLCACVKESETQYQSIIDSIDEGMIVINSSGRIIFSNRATYRIWGIDKEKVNGSDIRRFFTFATREDGSSLPWEETPPHLAIKLKRAFRGSIVGLKTNSSDIKWLSINIEFITPPLANGGEIIMTFFDNTEHIAQQKLIDLQKQKILSTAKMTALGKMAGGIAHEINNPLSIIYADVEDLHYMAEQEQKIESNLITQVTGRIEKTIQRIVKIIKGLRNFARSGDSDPFEMVYITKIWDDVFEFCEARLKKLDIDLKLNIDPEIMIECRSIQISQVLLNLINNSCDAIESLETRWISIETNDGSSSVKIVVTDSGNGIDEETRARIMDPFFTTKGVGKGSGLGLSISKGIIEEHKGSLDLDTTCKNTRFVITLPKRQ